MSEYVTVDMFQQLVLAMTKLKERILALESGPPPAAPIIRKREPTTYAMYLNMQQLCVKQGMDYKDAARQLNIPPSTAKAYLDWDAEKIEAKRLEQFRQPQ